MEMRKRKTRKKKRRTQNKLQRKLKRMPKLKQPKKHLNLIQKIERRRILSKTHTGIHGYMVLIIS